MILIDLSRDMPLQKFFTEAVCLDLLHKPLKSDISIAVAWLDR